jgi:hypothetical protein
LKFQTLFIYEPAVDRIYDELGTMSYSGFIDFTIKKEEALVLMGFRYLNEECW